MYYMTSYYKDKYNTLQEEKIIILIFKHIYKFIITYQVILD